MPKGADGAHSTIVTQKGLLQRSPGRALAEQLIYCMTIHVNSLREFALFDSSSNARSCGLGPLYFDATLELIYTASSRPSFPSSYRQRSLFRPTPISRIASLGPVATPFSELVSPNVRVVDGDLCASNFCASNALSFAKLLPVALAVQGDLHYDGAFSGCEAAGGSTAETRPVSSPSSAARLTPGRDQAERVSIALVQRRHSVLDGDPGSASRRAVSRRTVGHRSVSEQSQLVAESRFPCRPGFHAICPRCSYDFEVRFCAECGQSMAKVSNDFTCENCRTQGHSLPCFFCIHCGYNLQDSDPNAPSSSSSSSSPSSQKGDSHSVPGRPDDVCHNPSS